MNVSLIDVIVFALAILTLYSIIKGVSEACHQIKEVRSGKSIEQVKKEYDDRKKEKEKKQEKKFDSKFYRWTHPIEYGEMLLENKIKKKWEERK